MAMPYGLATSLFSLLTSRYSCLIHFLRPILLSYEFGLIYSFGFKICSIRCGLKSYCLK
uniref:Uncharacterized protein n=1 Tax=Rhizophora mucronata TaxID=61149 RepID=A0A2P2MXB0_RHIMU